MKPLQLALLFFIYLFSGNIYSQITYKGAVNTNHSNTIEMVISPDNKFAYTITSSSIQTYRRNEATGALTFMFATDTMIDGTALYSVANLAISPDGAYLYATGAWNTFVFSRNPNSGVATPFQTIEQDNGTVSNLSNNNIVVSNNNRYVYVTGGDNLFIYNHHPTTGVLSLVDSLRDMNGEWGTLGTVSLALSADNRLMYVTGGNGIKVFDCDTATGLLTFKNTIAGNNYNNQGLTHARQTVINKNRNDILYTVTNASGQGALVVTTKDPATDTLTVIQSLGVTIEPQFINITNDNRLLFISSGIASIANATMFFSIDSLTGKLRYISTYRGSDKYFAKKCMDITGSYVYTCPALSDSVYIHRFNLFSDSVVNICGSDVAHLSPRGNYSSYQWSNGASGANIITNTPGLYTLTATDSYGAVYFDTVQLNVRQAPDLQLPSNVPMYKGQVLVMWLMQYATCTWEWQGVTHHDSRITLDNTPGITTPQNLSIYVEDDYGCSATASLTITPLDDKSGFTIFPNPAANYVNISVSEKLEGGRITLSDITGSILAEAPVTPQLSTLNTNMLSRGVYIITIERGNSKEAQRFVVGK